MVTDRADYTVFPAIFALRLLPDREAAAWRALPSRVARLRSRTTIVSTGQDITECCLLVKGFACRSKVAHNGTRQIVSFHMPGDLLDVQHLLFDNADHDVETISESVLAFYPVQEMRDLLDEFPLIAKALWRDSLVDASVFREWVLNLGRRDAKQRIAHMLCEFAVLRERAGLGAPDEFPFPMSQADIGDATGLTSVHVNRMLRELRVEGGLVGNGRDTRIADWERLKKIARFKPEYLHLAA